MMWKFCGGSKLLEPPCVSVDVQMARPKSNGLDIDLLIEISFSVFKVQVHNVLSDCCRPLRPWVATIMYTRQRSARGWTIVTLRCM